MSFSLEEVTNFTEHICDTLFGSNKCNKLQRIQFTCKRKQIIEKLSIFFEKHKCNLREFLPVIKQSEGLFVYKCQRSPTPVKCAISGDTCHTYDEVHFLSPTATSKIFIRTDITDVLCKIHTFVHWQSFVISTVYTCEKIDHVKLYEQFCVLFNFINALFTRK